MITTTTTRVLLIALIGTYSTYAQSNGFCTLAWNDEFSASTLDTTKWQIEQTCSGGGNAELECYTPRAKNIYIQDGSLYLHAFKETYTGTQAGCTDTSGCTNTQQYTSGRINSSPATGGGNLLRGRMEIRAKLTSGSHLWPAIWMLPTDNKYGGWAASGEIDIMEQRGDHPNMISGTLHHGAAWPNNVYSTTGDKTFTTDLSQAYHVYAVEWTNATIKWFMDDYNFQTYQTQVWWNTSATNNPYTSVGQPWDQKFHFVLNVAVGGGFFNGYPALTDDQAAAWNTSYMAVDYVRAWSYGGDCSKSPFTDTSSNDTGLCLGLTEDCTSFCFPSNATLCDCDPNTGAKTVICNGESEMEASSDGAWLEKNAPILFGVIGGVALIAGISVLVVGIYLKKKRQFAVDPMPVQNVTIFPAH